MNRKSLGVGSCLTAAATLFVASGAWAQCDSTCPIGAVEQNDGCADQAADPNGGCNFAPVAYQDIGALSFGTPINICGTVGTWGTASRDLDWYRFSLATPALVSLSVVNQTESGTGDPASNITLFMLNGDDCDTQTTEFAAASGLCPFSTGEILLPAGNHVIIVTVNAFAPDLPACEVNYVATLTLTSEVSANCGTQGGDCLTPTPEVGGCLDGDVCACVCAFFPSCCDTGWDEACVDTAINFCGAFAYDCVKPAYANDCAPDAAAREFDSVIPFDNTGANTDGPATDCDTFHDLWWIAQVTEDGEFQIDVDSPTWDSTITIYGLGDTPTFDPSELPSLYIGCVDVLGAGGETAVLIDATAGYYLVQIGGFTEADAGAGTLTNTFRRIIYTTGNTNAVNFASTGTGTPPNCTQPFVLTNLGWSSGKLSAALQQRWAAAPFTIADPGSGFEGWKVQRINALGFAPAGVTNETLNYRIYTRTSLTTAPTDADLIDSGAVPFPVPFDIPGGGANEVHDMPVDIDLLPGDYWLTVYADNDDGPTVFANFAWFTNATDPIPAIGGSGPFLWRAATYPVPGYAMYTLGPCVLEQQAGLDPNFRYSPGFYLTGTKNPCPPGADCGPNCESDGNADFNDDGCVNGDDLGTLLGNWGEDGGFGIADLNCDGIVNGDDLGTLLGQWGGSCG